MAEEGVRIRPGGGNGTSIDHSSPLGRSETAAPPVQRVEVEETSARELPDRFGPVRDRVHWGPIVAGLLTALTTLLLLSLLGLAVGLTTVNAGTAAAQGAPPPDAGRNSAIWAGLAGILAFLLGGYVAARTAALFSRGWGALNGALVFMLAVPLILWLAGQGLGHRPGLGRQPLGRAGRQPCGH
jgi:MFS family permease